ncbi:hypothetical protein V6R21_00360 [Limibacter armeniacum]
MKQFNAASSADGYVVMMNTEDSFTALESGSTPAQLIQRLDR